MTYNYNNDLKNFTNLEWANIHKFIKAITRQIFDDYALTPDSDFIKLALSKRCYHQAIDQSSDDLRHHFYYGKKTLAYKFVHGYNEYRSIAYKIRGALPKPTGLKATYYVIIHENAHALQWARNGRFRGSVHNQIFVDAMNELLVRYPYETMVKAIFDNRTISHFEQVRLRARRAAGYALGIDKKTGRENVPIPVPTPVASVLCQAFKPSQQKQTVLVPSQISCDVAGFDVIFDHALKRMYSVICEDMTWGYATKNATNWYYDGRNFDTEQAVAEYAMNKYLNA